jgi:hypothetical protein
VDSVHHDQVEITIFRHTARWDPRAVRHRTADKHLPEWVRPPILTRQLVDMAAERRQILTRPVAVAEHLPREHLELEARHLDGQGVAERPPDPDTAVPEDEHLHLDTVAMEAGRPDGPAPGWVVVEPRCRVVMVVAQVGVAGHLLPAPVCTKIREQLE